MQHIKHIRDSLAKIDDALIKFPPEGGSSGQGLGVTTHTLWAGHDYGLNELGAPTRGSAHGDDGMGDDSAQFDPIFEIGARHDETIPVLGSEDEARIRQSIQVRGMDALGWYSPFHAIGVQWGVYIPLSGMVYLMQNVFADLPASAITKARLAFHAILHHELFHFATEYAIAQSELTQQQAWWAPANENRFRNGHKYLPVEEMLANAWMLKAFRTALPALRIPGKQHALRQFVHRQPEGYCDGDGVRTKAQWDQSLYDLAYSYAVESGDPDNSHLWWPGFDWPALFPIHPRIDWRFCPIHLVDDSRTFGLPPRWLDFFSHLSDVEESAKFKKRLSRLSLQVQQAWQRSKSKLQVAITAGDDFKRWVKAGPDVYSVRINAAFRAHLLHDRNTHRWIALDIGGHKEMGHG